MVSAHLVARTLLMRMLILSNLVWFIAVVRALHTETTFNGTQYIAYPIPYELGSTNDRIVLDFKTSEPYGVLLYSGGTQKDFVALEIIRGKLSTYELCRKDYGKVIKQDGDQLCHGSIYFGPLSGSVVSLGDNCHLETGVLSWFWLNIQ
eukprot:gene18690-20577_t